jgi:hypothetical protein
MALQLPNNVTFRDAGRALLMQIAGSLLLAAAVADKQLPNPEPGSMAYMMSKAQYLADGAKAWKPHLMFYIPKTDRTCGASWGANLPGSPFVLDSSDRGPAPWTQFFLPVSHWSDGTSAPLM